MTLLGICGSRCKEADHRLHHMSALHQRQAGLHSTKPMVVPSKSQTHASIVTGGNPKDSHAVILRGLGELDEESSEAQHPIANAYRPGALCKKSI
jgi:hypothetical protein